MNILLACQCSVYLRDLLRENGHDAWTCDLKKCEGDALFHLLGDAIDISRRDAPVVGRWDCMIAMPGSQFSISAIQSAQA